ncbi:dual specificity protein phosphatase family protein [Lacipirellula parvula]|uniref:Tyrosine specific protein phosphatases domain-containing protein n=1 Tax=Lacipirellula parvula TaxID=2650471 RepID=A0A5K7XCL7_9BACT|nr:dual specificity protein phosphatase family protein [Lacipirellula parvula]BBO34534.1 hypothetical protein PLANPX_4146 [Lacipirellula parvula]
MIDAFGETSDPDLGPLESEMASSSKYAMIFSLLALSCAMGALSSPLIVAPLLALTAIAFSLVAIAYSLRRPGLLGKAHNGQLRVAWGVPLSPFHFLNHLTFATFCRLDRASPWHEIVPGLYLGRRLRPREAALMPAQQILDLASEFSEAASLRARTYVNVPMLDGVAPTSAQLSEAVRLLRNSMRAGPTFVHCALGHGRSATVAAAFLLTEGYARTADDALLLIRQKRPSVRLSRGQRRLLEVWK